MRTINLIAASVLLAAPLVLAPQTASSQLRIPPGVQKACTTDCLAIGCTDGRLFCDGKFVRCLRTVQTCTFKNGIKLR